MIKNLQQIAEWAGARLEAADPEAGSLVITSVSTDTRTLKPGSLFVPLTGETFDGHDYIGQAVANGAAASFWQDGREIPAGAPPLLVADDPLAALQRLARAYRRELGLKVVGITGSNGKTTTKDLTASALSAAFSVHKTPGNLNNHIGLPITLLQIEEGTDVAIIEMGMSGRGEIALLTSIAEPNVAIITNIGESHLLQLGSREEIARAKTEILSGLAPGGYFIYNGDEPLIEQVLPEMPQPQGMTTLRFGAGRENDLYAAEIQQESDGSRFRINASGAPEFRIPLIGRHNVINALAAYAAARYLGVSDEQVRQGFASAAITGMRIERKIAASGAVILNDAYNASPTSTKAALALLAEAVGQGPSRKIAVLGDMLELGSREAEFHAEVGHAAAEAGVDRLYVYGPLSVSLAEAAKAGLSEESVLYYTDKGKLIEALRADVRSGDVVLIKASRGMRLEDAAQALLAT
ncbi:UDP-N-acetylmuramoyl-tripeptide--D-alanyl-D-alanine ligase [Gorillibacterium timonense]|uniref:UDP-N-acetylmuramoyl-tripeptide--D-alanyl-D- alanine ligase n=1 Tax=Gorillibacterium timonense TaxID=1689269 RepID=UPI00071CE48A|nr:UDP-N-acetylmuramoyl-tripeptide--D-alanyl-D-alanine ligase [Gorillibacterium timonense]